MYTVINTPIGNLKVSCHDQAVCKIDLNVADSVTELPLHPLLCGIIQQLECYLLDSKHIFDLPLELNGTEFQQRVWRALQQIPVGETLTYGMLAQRLKTSPRAVGNACRANPLPLIIPCHRIVGRQHLGGFAGARTGTLPQIKLWLLQHEGLKFTSV